MIAQADNRPAWLRWHHAIGRSTLTKAAKGVCWALLGYLRFEGDTGTAWPSEATLARDASLSTRTVRRELRALEAAGVLSIEPGGGRKPGGNGRSNHYALHLPALRALDRDAENADTVSPFNADKGDAEPGHGAQQARTWRAANADTVTAEPSREQAREPTTTNHGARGGAGGDSRSIDENKNPDYAANLAALTERGVRDREARELASLPGMTPQAIGGTMRAIVDDPSVRNRPAVLVHRLRAEFVA